MYIIASLVLSDLFGITGLIYANCVNMFIRIFTSLLYAFQLEKQPKKAFKTFIKDLIIVDVTFILGMVKRVASKGRNRDK